MTLFLISCGNNSDIENAKKELLSDNQIENTSVDSNDNSQDIQTDTQSLDTIQDPLSVQVISLSEQSFLNFDDISNDFMTL
jgi:hypothetical protein